jgi:hypothetical protein
MDSVYAFRVLGTVGPAIRAAFPELSISTEPAHTILRGSLADRRQLEQALELLRSHGLKTVSIRLEDSRANTPDGFGDVEPPDDEARPTHAG